MLKLRDIMTRDVLTLSPETTLRQAIDVLAAHHVGGAPVTAGSKVVGVVSVSDILDFESDTPLTPAESAEQVEAGVFAETPREYEAEDEPLGTYYTELWTDTGTELDARFEAAAAPQWDLLAEHTVDEVMTRRVQAMSPDATVDAAANQMRERGIHRVLVKSGDDLLGIVTTMDIAKAVADHKLTVRQYVFDRRGSEEDRESQF